MCSSFLYPRREQTGEPIFSDIEKQYNFTSHDQPGFFGDIIFYIPMQNAKLEQKEDQAVHAENNNNNQFYQNKTLSGQLFFGNRVHERTIENEPEITNVLKS